MSNNIRNTVLSIMEGLVTVDVVFEEHKNAKRYKYLALKEEGYKVGDNAVVESQSGSRMVEVVSVDEAADVDVDSQINYKFLLARVDLEAHADKSEKVDHAVRFFKHKQREQNRIAARNQMLEETKSSAEEVSSLLSFGSVVGIENDNNKS